jgi:hypothetical protein
MPLANSNGAKIFWNEAGSGDPMMMIWLLARDVASDVAGDGPEVQDDCIR